MTSTVCGDAAVVVGWGISIAPAAIATTFQAREGRIVAAMTTVIARGVSAAVGISTSAWTMTVASALTVQRAALPALQLGTSKHCPLSHDFLHSGPTTIDNYNEGNITQNFRKPRSALVPHLHGRKSISGARSVPDGRGCINFVLKWFSSIFCIASRDTPNGRGKTKVLDYSLD